MSPAARSGVMRAIVDQGVGGCQLGAFAFLHSLIMWPLGRGVVGKQAVPEYDLSARMLGSGSRTGKAGRGHALCSQRAATPSVRRGRRRRRYSWASSCGSGVLGCGNISGTHARAVAGLPDAALAAVADIDLPRAEALGAEFGVPAYADLPEMLAGERPGRGDDLYAQRPARRARLSRPCAPGAM